MSRQGVGYEGSSVVTVLGSFARRLRKNTESQLLVVTIAAALILALSNEYFLSTRNLRTLLAQSAVIAVGAMGKTFVLATGGIDLSMGTVMALAGVLGATIIKTHGLWIGFLVFLLIGFGFGLVNGVSVAYFKMAPFIVTLATMSIARGIAFYFTQASSVSGLPAVFLFIGEGTWLCIPVIVILAGVAAVIMELVLSYSVFGRQVKSIGSNVDASRTSGIPVERITLLTYVLGGFCAGLAGFLLTARLGAAAPGMGDQIVLDLVAASVVGGASLFGGEGTIRGTLLGVLLIGLLSNGMNLFGVSTFVQMVFKGILILAVVLLDRMRKVLES